jgi:uncharacterized protein
MFGASKKDETFYGAFRDEAELAVSAAKAFAALLGDIASSEKPLASIQEDEKRARATLRRTIRELHTTWITPLDRHHIHELVLGIDRVIDLIHATAVRVTLFGIREARPDAKEMAQLMLDACARIRKATDLLPKLTKEHAEEVMRLVGEVHEIEGRADETHRRGLAQLFEGGTDPLTVIKWREVLDNLDAAVDVCREVAQIFEAIVLENA